MSTEWIILIVGVLFSILIGVSGYLLSRKDSQQEDSIKNLHAMHDADVLKLESLTRTVDKHHYEKHEVDNMFVAFRGYLDERFDRIEKIVIK